MGLTTLNKGDPVAGLAAIKASLSCKYTASEALAALNKIYLLMMGADKDNNPTPLVVRTIDRSTTGDITSGWVSWWSL